MNVRLEFERPPSVAAYMIRAVFPATRLRDRVPSIVARWRAHRVDRRDLDAFLRVVGAPRRSTLPLLYPHTFGFRLSMAILTHPAFPVPIWGVLQTRNHLVQHRPIAADASLDFETRVGAARVLDKGAEWDLETTVRVGADVAWESVVTFFARGRFGEPGAPSPLARAPEDLGARVAEWMMRDDGHYRFGRFTGDFNGIHLWDAYARRFGFRRALYHPPRVLGECLARLPTAPSDAPQRLDAWLKGPVPHGATVRLHANAGADGTTFGAWAGDERPAIVGRVRALASTPRITSSS